jgi:RNA polymerase sigma-70 factor (ECF subfamily)
VPSLDPDPRTPASLLFRVRDLADGRSWRDFVELYTPLILLWAGKLGVPRGDRPDVAQLVFTQLVRELPHFVYDPARRFRGYLFTLVRSRAVDHLRARRGDPVGLPDGVELSDSDPADAVARDEYNRHLARHAARILTADFDPVTLAAFRRYAVEREDARAVAADLGVAVATVYQAKSRVTRRLRDELAGLLD